LSVFAVVTQKQSLTITRFSISPKLYISHYRFVSWRINTETPIYILSESCSVRGERNAKQWRLYTQSSLSLACFLAEMPIQNTVK